MKFARHFISPVSGAHIQCAMALLIAVCGAVFSPVHAQAASCSVFGAQQLVFSYYDPLSRTDHDNMMLLTVFCQPGVRGELVVLNVGIRSGGNDGADRRLQGTTDSLRFGLYSDPAHATLIVDETRFSFSETLINNQLFFLPVYGRIYAGQNVGAGNYMASLIVTMDY